MTRHGHLHRSAINAIATESTTECRDYPNSASSTTKLQRRKYSMMTRRCLDTINSRSALSCRLTRQRISSPETAASSTVDDSAAIFATCHLSRRYSSSTHLCDMSPVDTSLVINPLSETLQQRRRYATVRRATVSARSTALRSPGTDQFVTL